MTLLAMVRHAETRWSREGRIQGRTDIPLSDAGRAFLQCRALPAEFTGMRVVSSPLKRCMESASLLGTAQVQVDSRIAEMHWGKWEGCVLADLRNRLGDAMRDNESRGWDFTPPGGESPRRVLERMRGWLAEVAASGRPTLAVAHRGVIRVVLAAATGWDMLGRPPVKLDWAAVHLFDLDTAGQPAVARMNVPLAMRQAAS